MSKRRRLLLLVCSALVMYGSWGVFWRWHATHGHYTPGRVASVTDTPSELQVSGPRNVPPDQPKQISLPTIQASGPVQQVNNQAGAVGTPDSILLAGWYTRSVKPGDAGLSIIDGHVQGSYKPGIFKNLGHLKMGDSFTVIFGDNSVRKFQVVSLRVYSVKDASRALFAKAANIKSQLNLITCDGTLNASKQFDDRLIVESTRIK